MAAEAVPVKDADTHSYKGKFHFVNYDHDRKTAPHRNAVFTHVQGQYWRWKRKEDNRLLRESAKIPVTEARKQNQKEAAIGQETSIQQPHLRPPLPIGDGRPASNGASSKSEIELEQIPQYAHGPVTVLKKGQSDPFNAFAIPIDSRVNFLMTYCREVELPSIHRDGTNPNGHFSTEEWSSIVGHFQEPYAGYALLTRIASAIPVETDRKSDLAVTAMTFRGKVVSLLRDKIAEEGAMGDARVFGAIASMLHAEMYNNNVTGALFHAKMMAHMLQSGTVAVNPRRTFEAIYYDYQRAIMSFSRTCFDYDLWVPQYFAPVWSEVYETLPASAMHAAVAKGLDSTVDDDKLRQLFITLRHLIQVFVLAHVNVKFQTNTVRVVMRSTGVYVMGQALNHYLNSAMFLDVCRTENVLVGKHVTQALVQAVISLALLYWTRVVSKTDSFVIGEHKTIFVANAGLLKRFREAYADYDTFTLADTVERYSRCMLWALYVGAWSEQMQKPEKGDGDVRKDWFSSRLGSHAKDMGLRSWQPVREVLLGFIHFDNLPSDGSLWFHKVLEKVEVSMPRDSNSD